MKKIQKVGFAYQIKLVSWRAFKTIFLTGEALQNSKFEAQKHCEILQS